MLVLGLTGSLGMGKSTVASMFAEKGVPAFNADETVHDLYRSTAAPLVEKAFPGTTADGTVDREELGRRVLGDAAALEKLEAIVHPLIREEETKFRAEAASAGRRIIVLDIPLLFETGGETRVDAVVLVSTRPEIQKERVLARPGMTEERFDAILKKQMPDAEKRKRAHFIVDTTGDFDATRRQVDDVLKAVAAMAAGK
jgi:dephospho-CoA kinase